MKSRVLFLSLVIASLLLGSCSKKDGLVGRWTADGQPTVAVDAGAMSGMISQILEQALVSGGGSITEVTFNADGTGTLVSDGETMPFTYTSTSSNVTFTFDAGDMEGVPFTALTANYTIAKKSLTLNFDFTDVIRILIATEYPEAAPYLSGIKSVTLSASYKKAK